MSQKVKIRTENNSLDLSIRVMVTSNTKHNAWPFSQIPASLHKVY